MKQHVTLSGTINELGKQGYTEDFNLQQQCLGCRNGEYKLFAGDFIVDKYYRFEGETNPSDASILYAISSDRHQLKGILVNGYGIYSEPASDEIMEKLQIRTAPGSNL
ncbi:MAG: phosphoribosylpyrophosphate synthetase [Ginsengibacter sp.]